MIRRGMLLVAIAALFLYAAPISNASIIASQTDDSASASLSSGDGLFAQDYLYYLGTGSGFTGTLQDLKLRFDSKGSSWRASLYCRDGSDYASAACSTFGGTPGIDSPSSSTYSPAPSGLADYTATWSGTNIFEASKHYFFRLIFNTESGMFDPAPVLRGSTDSSSYSGSCDPIQSTAGFCDILPDIYFVLNTVTVTPVLSAVTIVSSNASTTVAKTGDTVTLSFTSTVGLGAVSATIAGNSAAIATTSATSTATYQLVSGDTEGTIVFSLSYASMGGTSGFITSTTTDSTSVLFDKTVPVLTIDSGPAEGGYASTTSPSFSFTATDIYLSETSCAWDGAATSTCTSPIASILADGTHTFAVVASDSAGNSTTLMRNFTLDTAAPALAEVAVIATSTDTTPEYSFTSAEAGALAFVGACSAATSTVGVGTTTLTFAALAVGSYSSCSLSVTDVASNTGTLAISPFAIEAVPEPPAPAPAPSGGGGGGGGGIIGGPLSVGYQIPYLPPPAPAPAPSAPEPQAVQVTVGASTGGSAVAAPEPAAPTQSIDTDVREISNVQTQAAPAPAAPSVRSPVAVVTPWDTPAGKQINLAAAATSGFQLPNWVLIVAAALLAILGAIAWSLRRRHA